MAANITESPKSPNSKKTGSRWWLANTLILFATGFFGIYLTTTFHSKALPPSLASDASANTLKALPGLIETAQIHFDKINNGGVIVEEATVSVDVVTGATLWENSALTAAVTSTKTMLSNIFNGVKNFNWPKATKTKKGTEKGATDNSNSTCAANTNSTSTDSTSTAPGARNETATGPMAVSPRPAAGAVEAKLRVSATYQMKVRTLGNNATPTVTSAEAPWWLIQPFSADDKTV